ncbi:hypothetical protein BDP81DRAFT_20338 [Colletotrichum phormii]|uniref:Uncharacterized protein n=1 Tax=Colletotrichum phormii TaxID=359342 RepID=A0AAJ0A899_9PEZI|nr:uncharacterized protein BDP81DRAFT_20338 [Colletotrichum phormii]KAK1656365.1 hypothetical protein BDP81DRAFT_20338 [Colletotrichum phormii]
MYLRRYLLVSVECSLVYLVLLCFTSSTKPLPAQHSIVVFYSGYSSSQYGCSFKSSFQSWTHGSGITPVGLHRHGPLLNLTLKYLSQAP